MRGDGSRFDDDEFARLVLDEQFVEGGERELSAEDRVRLQALVLEQAFAKERGVPGPTAKSGAWPRRLGGAVARHKAPLVIAIVLGLLALFLAWQDGVSNRAPSLWSSAFDVARPTEADQRPTPQPAPSATPLGTPALPAPSSTSFHFTALQPGSTAPIAYDPCRVIKLVVNRRTMPPGGDELLDTSLRRLSGATGLKFVIEGSTDEAPSERRPAYLPERYGDRWAPVLVAWTDPQELPELKDDVAGLAGSTWVSAGRGQPDVYVSGLVALDGPQLTQLIDHDDDPDGARAVIMHELGHLVGLDHVNDPGQLMYPEGQPGITVYQPGDLAGLARLGQGACVPQL